MPEEVITFPNLVGCQVQIDDSETLLPVTDQFSGWLAVEVAGPATYKLIQLAACRSLTVTEEQ